MPSDESLAPEPRGAGGSDCPPMMGVKSFALPWAMLGINEDLEDVRLYKAMSNVRRSD